MLSDAQRSSQMLTDAQKSSEKLSEAVESKVLRKVIVEKAWTGEPKGPNSL